MNHQRKRSIFGIRYSLSTTFQICVKIHFYSKLILELIGEIAESENSGEMIDRLWIYEKITKKRIHVNAERLRFFETYHHSLPEKAIGNLF